MENLNTITKTYNLFIFFFVQLTFNYDHMPINLKLGNQNRNNFSYQKWILCTMKDNWKKKSIKI